MKNNRLTSILLVILIILSGVNLLVSVSNTIRINQLENAPPVVIKEFETGATTAEKHTLTFKNEEATKNDTSTSADTQEPSTEKESSTEAKTEEPSSEEAQNSSVCYVTASGTKYHKAGCSYLKKSKTQMTVSEAKSCGYSPCSRCY